MLRGIEIATNTEKKGKKEEKRGKRKMQGLQMIPIF